VQKRRLPRRSQRRRRATVAMHNKSYSSARLCITMTSQKKYGMKFYYTYILQSHQRPDRFYIGFTEHLESRLKSNNRGENPYTSKHKPGGSKQPSPSRIARGL
jgi:hypothetical protein